MVSSLGLNTRFQQAVKDLVGEDQFEELEKTIGFEEAVLYFDRFVKTTFKDDPEQDFYVNFPMADLKDDPANRLISNCWAMLW